MKDRHAIGFRPTWAEINLNNLEYNFKQLSKIVGPGVKVMVTVKADAYGHGLIKVSKKLEALGVDYLGVASIDEGIMLRKAGVNTPILILGVVLKNDIGPIFEYDLSATVCSKELAIALNKKGRMLFKAAKVHVKIDTGMNRIGVLSEDAVRFIKWLKKMEYIDIEGAFTHLAFADLDRNFTNKQINIFSNIISSLGKNNINIPIIHAANSMGVINYKDSHFNMVRPGLVIYGLYPVRDLKIILKPVLSLKTKIIYKKVVPKGSGISYGHIYITKKRTTIVTLPIGYGDGYPRILSNKADVLIGGRRFRISGRICMDQIMVDVGDFPVKVGQEVVLIGRQLNNEISAEELSVKSSTIPYEIVCGLGSRIPRVYID
ncbi:MAG: alanine racemase [Candidatus Omnitrophota bacterium]|jgi:alanine racemase|nr:MAG: alanine racemase [Candidatus Omnitrophota bacterium]